MSLRSEERVIDGFVVKVTQLPAMRSMGLLPRIGQSLIPALAKLDNGMLGKSLADIHVEELAPAAGAFFATLTADELQKFIRDVNVSTQVQINDRVVTVSTDEAINAVFGGDILTVLKVTMFALEVNFSSFFGGGRKTTTAPVAVEPVKAG